MFVTRLGKNNSCKNFLTVFLFYLMEFSFLFLAEEQKQDHKEADNSNEELTDDENSR